MSHLPVPALFIFGKKAVATIEINQIPIFCTYMCIKHTDTKTNHVTGNNTPS